MIDVEADVFDRAARAVLAKFPKAFVSSEQVAAPKSFPAVSVIEFSNMVADSRRDSSGEEKGALIAYQCDCYSNRRSGAKKEAKALAEAVDAAMRAMGFQRTYGAFVQNVTDTSVYRYTTRYSAMAGNAKGGVTTIFRS